MEQQLEHVPEVDKISFSEEEEKIFQFWKSKDVFKQCLKQSKDKPRYTFFDGPPFATGLPHYGHILAGTIKDIVTRWAHQTGHHVERRFGWDTHGLPVEYEIDKTYDFRGPEDVEKIGIKKYNELCRAIVSRYAKEWEQIISRLGRWIDFENDYKTMYPWYMESIWWIFSQLYQKGLVYRGVKVMPFSTACSTPLSNFEAGQNYKDTQDPSVVVSFPLVEDPSIKLVAWTTTPWTLPSNLALCVNPDADYVKVKGKTNECDGIFILMEARLTQLFKTESDYEVLGKMKGKDLEGKRYQPLFDYFLKAREKGAFQVLTDNYVSSESGTGVVHQAPYFGEDDFRICLSYGIITRDQEPVCPVDDVGRFMDSVHHFKGVHVKEADSAIIKHLRNAKRLVQSDRVNHSYPYCWRSDTPLIYRAVPSWFIRVQDMQDKLLQSNEKTYWVPNFVKEKRFANWLRDARDWAISRNRYWGTPIPLWVSEDMQEIVCIGSIKQLEELSGEKITDLHRDSIDHITIPSVRPGCPPLKRISEVFDCWFESGSMPYAQVHYPFENKKEFEDCFPADFIAEGIDQTRGWFYTLLVLSTALFGKPPFKNLIVHGLVLASDGQKMSKRKKNYPDPMDVANKYGADALRLYLTSSPVVRGDNLRFTEADVFGLLKEVFIPWLNAYRFFVQQVKRLEKEENETFIYDDNCMGKSTNVMDRWIISFTQSLLEFVHREMTSYRLYNVTPRLIKFVDNLTNWYVRFNRRRLKGETDKQDCLRALETLYAVLLCMIRVMAPFTPFITEMMFQNLRKVLMPGTLGQVETESVHYLMVPFPKKELICSKIEASVSTLQSIVELGRYIRDKVNSPLKYPLPEVIIIHKDEEILNDVLLLESYIKEELNVRAVKVSTDKEKYGVSLKAEVNFKLLGARLKGDVKKIQSKVTELSDGELQSFLEKGWIDILGHCIESSELTVKYRFSGDKTSDISSNYEAHSDASVLILLDTSPSQDMLDEGLAREITNRMQKLRKKAKLLPTDDVTIWYNIAPSSGDVAKVASSHLNYIENSTKTPFKPIGNKTFNRVLIEEESKIKDSTLKMVITMNSNDSTKTSVKLEAPCCPWVNVCCLDMTLKDDSGSKATLLLENPKGKLTMRSIADFKKEINALFGNKIKNYDLFLNGKLLNDGNLENINGKTIYVTSKQPTNQAALHATPFIRYVNLMGKNERACVLLENPNGCFYPSQSTFLDAVKNIFGISRKIQLYFDEKKSSPVVLNGSFFVEELSFKTLYL